MIQTFAGENDAVRLAAVKKTVDEFVSKYTDMGLERLDGEEVSYDRIVEAVQSLPFLAERKLVVLKDSSKNKEFTERFETFLASVTDSTDVLISEGKLDKRTSFYKLLQKKTDFVDCKVLDANALVRCASEYVQTHGGTLSMADARFLVERTASDQIGLEHELDKLLAYDTAISRKTIELLTDERPQSRIFDLLDAAFRGDTRRTLALYVDQRAQGIEPQIIISMIIWQLYIFAVVKSAGARSAQIVAKTAKLNPFVVEKSQAAVRGIALSQLKRLITELRILDVRSKTESIVLDDALQYYLLTLSLKKTYK